jgi:fumarate hydratase class II
LALANFGVSGRPMPLAVIRSLARIKAAMAAANGRFDSQTGIDAELAEAIRAAALEVADGGRDDEFRIDAYQTGSGTSTNMNVNEVIATLAGRRLTDRDVHPNDHVNASQSSNDVFPTAIRIAALVEIGEVLLPGLSLLSGSLGGRSVAFATVVKSGRTHLMDASPVTLGQEFAGYQAQIDEAIERLQQTCLRVAVVPLGGTATGNGLNCPAGVAELAIAELASDTGLPLRPASNRFALQGSQDALVELSGQLRGAALAMFKIANDVRLMASGPRTGLGEIRLPELQPGSSIMPGKVNPILCEVVTQVAAQAIGNDAAIAFAGSQGTLELNTYLPVIAINLLDTITLLGRSASDFARRCVDGIEADVERCRQLAELSPSTAAALNRLIGYDAATEVVRRALSEDRAIRSVLIEQGVLDTAQIDAALDVDRLAAGTSPTGGAGPGRP